MNKRFVMKSLILILIVFGIGKCQGMLVTKIIEHNLIYDSSSGKVMHIVRNLYKYNLTNITIIDKCGKLRKRFVIPLLLPGEEKRIEYSPDISQNCTLVSKTFYWLEGNEHELVEKKIKVPPKKRVSKAQPKNIQDGLLFVAIFLLLMCIVVIFAKKKI